MACLLHIIFHVSFKIFIVSAETVLKISMCWWWEGHHFTVLIFLLLQSFACEGWADVVKLCFWLLCSCGSLIYSQLCSAGRLVKEEQTGRRNEYTYMWKRHSSWTVLVYWCERFMNLHMIACLFLCLEPHLLYLIFVSWYIIVPLLRNTCSL